MATGSGVLVVIETSAGIARDASLEALAYATQIADGGPVSAVVVGNNVGDVASTMAADTVYVVDSPLVERYTADGYTAAIEAAVSAASPAVVLLGGTTSGRDLGPYLAARAGVNCLSDCVELRREGSALIGTRPVYQGKLLSDTSLSGEGTSYAVLRGGVVDPAASGTPGSVTPLDAGLSDDSLRVKLVEVNVPPVGAVDLQGAGAIVAGGRGVGSAEGFEALDKLASVVGGAVGATRAVTDLGWRPHYEQIGQTGKTVKPRLYFAIGISGAVQHVVGMQGSETVVAINRDPDAPIFKLAQIGIVGDLNEILPALIAELEAAGS